MHALKMKIENVSLKSGVANQSSIKHANMQVYYINSITVNNNILGCSLLRVLCIIV